MQTSPVARHQFDILYIEDNPANLRLVERILGSAWTFACSAPAPRDSVWNWRGRTARR
jgi:CheY-like chemotaxis protein